MRKARKVLLVVSLFFAFFVLVALCFFVAVNSGVSSKDFTNFRTFQSFVYNPNDKSIISENIDLPVVLKGDEVISYETLSGKQVLVSNFGSKKFECSGTCYCEDERRGVSSAVKPLSYLFAAASTVVAISMSQKYFEQSCKDHLMHACVGDRIKYSVEDCLPVEALEDQFDISRKYWCSGECVAKPRIIGLKNHEEIEKDVLDFANEMCPKFNPSAFVELAPDELTSPERKFELMHYERACMQYSNMVFQKYSIYCETLPEGFVKSPIRERIDKLQEQAEEVLKVDYRCDDKKLHMCEAPKYPGNEMSPSIKCEKIEDFMKFDPNEGK